jgi:hypothetical protein
MLTELTRLYGSSYSIDLAVPETSWQIFDLVKVKDPEGNGSYELPLAIVG